MPLFIPNSAPANHLNIIDIDDTENYRTKSTEPSQLNQVNFALLWSGCYHLGSFKLTGEEARSKTGVHIPLWHSLAYVIH